MDNQNDNTDTPKMTEKNEVNLYDKILDLRKFEIENFWKRTLFFWGTLAIVLIAYFKSDLPIEYFSFISLIGLLYNVIFSLSIRGSKYWQEHWEVMAAEYESKFKFSILNDEAFHPHYHSKFTYPYRFSVSKLTMLLSDITVLMWAIFWIKDIINLVRLKDLKFHFSPSNSIDYFTVGFMAFHIVLLLYFTLFMCYGKVYYKSRE